MGSNSAPLTGPDFADGIAEERVVQGAPLLGHALGEAVLLVRDGAALFAVAAACPHYGAPLAEGLQVGSTIRCPWHHASFDLATGAGSAPALNPLACFELERTQGTVRVTGRRKAAAVSSDATTRSVVIIGGGAAGQSAAETLRLRGHRGSITVLSADRDEPYDRPNLSKDYLAGTAPEEWIPLRSRADYADRRIDLRTSARVTAVDPARRTVTLVDGTSLTYDALLLATGAAPVKLNVPGATAPHVHVLRTLTDARGLIARARTARRVAVIGASFIGLEAASALRSRGLEVDVVGREATPMERVFGPEVGAFIQRLHEEKGVRFHLKTDVVEIDPTAGVRLANGTVIAADLVVVGIGVQPDTELAQRANLAMDSGGVRTDAYLRTSDPHIWAAGDIARWPDVRSGRLLRVEHWVVAQKQGAIAARNILGERIAFSAVPFFWTVQHGVTLSYVGNAVWWDTRSIDGSIAARDFTVRYFVGGRLAAALSVGRDRQSLELELELEREAAR